MSQLKYIKKKKAGVKETEFSGLKRKGIELIRNLSGSVWTDHNLHDPGITILEQLCFALSELAYRADFPVADFLTGKEGTIDFNSQCLFLPEQVFPSIPVTETDLRKVILDSFPDIDNVWIAPGQKEAGGLFDIIVKLNENSVSVSGKRDKERLKKKIRNLHASQRNLCEDIRNIIICGNSFYHLYADIEISNDRPAIDVLSEIYFRCSQKIDPGIRFFDYEDLLAEGWSVERILSGPLTRHGHLSGRDLRRNVAAIHISEVINLISQVPGVINVRKFCLLGDDAVNTETIPRDSISSAPCLKLPEEPDEIGIALYRKKMRVNVPSTALRERLEKWELGYNARRYTRQNIRSLYTLPEGKKREVSAYYSIQNHFPAAYGINSYGVPASAPPEVKARAGQLKAYLMLFEQIMANTLSDLEKLPELFSLDERGDKSYTFQFLDDSVIPDITRIYRGYSQKRREKFIAGLERVTRRHDRFHERKTRLLDYLLALYGEKFSQKALGHYNFYYTKKEEERVHLQNRIKFLKHIIAFNRDRSRSFNYRELSWNTGDVSGLKMRVSILLGLPTHTNRSLTAVFIKEGLKIIPDEELAGSRLGSLELRFANLDRLEDRLKNNFHAVKTSVNTDSLKPKQVKALLDEVLLLKNNVINASFLRHGLSPERYRVGSFSAGKSFQVIFKPYGEAEWCYLCRYGTKERAILAVNCLYRFIRTLNIRSEGFHVIEHILLSPMIRNEHEVKVPDDFYPFRISLLFPAWTARFSNAGFRELAEETVRINCPAHICPDFYWLDFDEMLEFELVYKRWLILKSEPKADKAETDAYSEKIIKFLL